MVFTTLVDTATVAENLNSNWHLLDCRFVLADPGDGERRYKNGHIPGARYLHLDRDLSGEVSTVSGRHPLPDPVQLAEKLASMGVSQNSQLVAYDDAGGVFAARLWWLMRWLGHSRVAVLDGGITQWLKERRQLSREKPRVMARGNLQAKPNNADWLTSAAVRQCLEIGSGRLLDARAATRFRGEQEPIDAVAGHVPGAVNLPYTELLTESTCFKPSGVLRQRLQAALAGVMPAETVCMCGSGVTACHILLAMEVAGLKGGRLYAGSWSEWIRDPEAPVEPG